MEPGVLELSTKPFLNLVDFLFEPDIGETIYVRRQLKFALVKDCDALPSEANEKHPQLKHHILPGAEPDLFRFTSWVTLIVGGQQDAGVSDIEISFKLFDNRVPSTNKICNITGSSFILCSSISNCSRY